MDILYELISSQVTDPALVQWIFIALVGLAALAFALSLVFVVNVLVSPFRQRMAVLTENGSSVAEPGGKKLGAAVQPWTEALIPSKGWERSQLHARLVHAGYRSDNAINTFYAIKVLLGLIGLVGYLVGASFFPEMTTVKVAVYAAAAGFIGFILPNYVLEKMANDRIRVIRNSFPDALDLLVVCVESGLGLSAALQRVAQELEVSHPELSDELALVNAEVRAGINRIEALRDMAERTGVEEIKGLVALLEQSVRFGGSIADTLRIYSEEFRDKRMQRAEEIAAKIGTKLIFPLTICLWPGFFVVAVGPAILKVLAAMGS